MFKRKTVIVVGAGASKEVGLPTGDELKFKIAEKLDIKFGEDTYYNPIQVSGDRKIYKAYIGHEKLGSDLKAGQLVNASHKLRSVLPQALSIDTVLDTYANHPDIISSGKLGIVSSIIEAEQGSKLYSPNEAVTYFQLSKIQDTWFHRFSKLLVEGSRLDDVSRALENLTFIVFNYDRCIEYFVAEAILNYHTWPAAKIRDVLDGMLIFHPYGSLGVLKWRNTQIESGVGFGEGNGDLMKMANAIKTYSERIEDSAELQKMKGELESAEVIVFLGFAFHRPNMELLSVTRNSNVKHIYATAYGCSESDVSIFNRRIMQSAMPYFDNGAKIVIRRDLTCAGLFQEYGLEMTG